MTGYYDFILGLIPLSLIGITAVLSVAGFSITSAVPFAASVPVLLIGHALFVNGPTDDAAGPSTESVDSPGFEAAD